MRREGALSRSESRPVRQEKGFAEGTRFSGRLCLPDSAGAGPGRLPALLGLPSGRTKSPLTWPLSSQPARQNEIAIDLAFKQPACKAEQNGR